MQLTINPLIKKILNKKVYDFLTALSKNHTL